MRLLSEGLGLFTEVNTFHTKTKYIEPVSGLLVLRLSRIELGVACSTIRETEKTQSFTTYQCGDDGLSFLVM